MSKEDIALSEKTEVAAAQAEADLPEETVTDPETIAAATAIDAAEDDEEDAPEERKVLFMKAAQGYGMILGFGVGYILSGILSEMGLAASKFECVILCMFAGTLIGYLLSRKK